MPESEGGNAAYCSVQAGLNHCLTGTRPAGYRPEQRPAKDDSAWGGSIRAAIRDEWAPSPGLGGPALPPRPGAATPPAPSALQLRVMDPRSLLVVGKAAVVYERSFSGRAKVPGPSPPLSSSLAPAAAGPDRHPALSPLSRATELTGAPRAHAPPPATLRSKPG